VRALLVPLNGNVVANEWRKKAWPLPIGEVEHGFQGEAERELAREALKLTLTDSVR
jgi:hypothetical protein